MNVARKDRLWFSLFALVLSGLLAGQPLAEESDDTRRDSLHTLFRIPQADIKDVNLRDDIAPKPELQALLARLQAVDKTATVTWFRGHVDSFTSAPKATIPDYAIEPLQKAGLSLEPTQPAQFGTITEKKTAMDWDAAPDLPLPFVSEQETPPVRPSDEKPDAPEGSYEGEVKDITRPASEPLPPTPPANQALDTVAHQVLLGFLHKYQTLFELPDDDLKRGLPTMGLVQFGTGRYFHRLLYQQQNDVAILHNGKTVVLFDHNWNVIAISRLILTREKTADILDGDRPIQLTESQAVEIALDLTRQVFGGASKIDIAETTLGLQAVNGIYSWKIRLLNADPYYSDILLTLDATSGKLLNVEDNVDRYTDAKVSRWGYATGDYTAPIRYTSSNFYTRDDNSLVHDFFHVVTDNRNNGDPLHACTETPQNTSTESDAYGSTSGSNYIRPTLRSDRDFSLWWPSETSGTFGEAHIYYWARWFMQWMKPALSDLGVLPSSAADYPRALIIANSCNDGVGVHNSSFSVTTLNSVGEGINTIRLPERCRSTNGSCASADYASSNSGHIYTFEGNAGYSAPGVIQHEINHFVMKRYFDIGSGLDCSSGVQLKFLHEGAAGRSLPQAYWHDYYGSGYAPSNQNRNYRHHQVSGRPHTSDADLNKLSDFLCVNTDSPYNAGSVVHQAMWKFYHGIAVNGSAQSSIPRFSTDRDFVLVYYWAADLVSGSTYQDRYEMANRVMEIMENHSNLSSSGKQSWCDVWDVHELDTFILNGYCS